MSSVNHKDRDHALLSASGASRWMACTPSARLEEKAMVKDSGSIYSKEGTLAHELSDIMLQKRWKNLSDKGFNAEKRKIRTAVKKLFPDSPDLIMQEMETEVQKYVDIVSEAYLAALTETPDAVLMLEERLDYSHVVPEGFGTGDAIIIGNLKMRGFDLKYGRGIVVDAKLNQQQMLYSLGALRKFEMHFDIGRVEMNIVQPRVNNYSTWETSANYIESWAEKIVRPKAVAAFEGSGEKHAGDWCKWCKIKPVCRAAMDKNLEMAQHDFKLPEEVPIDELAEVMLRMDMFTDWISSVKAYLVQQAMAGKEVPHFKLVEGRSNRKWVNEDRVTELLTENGFTEDQYMKSSLEGITKIEKLVGKDDFYRVFSETIVKPPGAPTLVHESDRRDPIGSLAEAKKDFK